MWISQLILSWSTEMNMHDGAIMYNLVNVEFEAEIKYGTMADDKSFWYVFSFL